MRDAGSPLIPRPRLFARLDAAVQSPITVVCGPAGAGKTALIQTWLATPERAGAATAWVRLGARCADRGSFWAAVLKALPVDGALAAPNSGPTDNAAAMFAALTEPLLLVLDDARGANDSRIIDDVATAMRGAPLLRIVVTCRRHPRATTHHALLANGITVIGADELAFTSEEVGALLPAADTETVERTTARTSGWALAVALEAHGGRRRHPADEFADFVADELLRSVPDDERQFLLRTSIVDELTPTLAAAVSGEPDAAQRLHNLRQDGLLAAAAGGQDRLRYPPVVLEALRRELGALPPGEPSALHRRAVDCHLRGGDAAAALRQARSCGDSELLIDLLHAEGQRLYVGHRDEVAAAIAALPGGVATHDPALLTLTGMIQIGQTGDPRAAAPYLRPASGLASDLRTTLLVNAALLALERAEHDYPAEQALASATAKQLADIAPDEILDLADSAAAAHAAVGVSWIIAGRLAEAEQALETARHLGKAADTPVTIVYAAGHLALIHALRGHLDLATRYLDEAVRIVTRPGWSADFVDAPMHVAAALTAVERGESRTAWEHLRLAKAAGRQPGQLPFLAYTEALAHLLDGNHAVGLEMLDNAMAHDPAPERTLSSAMIETARAKLLAVVGRRDEALQAAARVADDAEHTACSATAAGFTQLVTGDAESAFAAVRPCVESAEPHAPRTLLMALLISSVAGSRLGRGGSATTNFQRALAIAHVTGSRRSFRLIPQPMLVGLIARVRLAGAEPAICRLCDTLAPATAGPGALPSLSERERLTLAHLETGLTVAEVAAMLYVSPNTLKTQIRSIYKKLGVSSRSAALAEGHKLGLI